jgi:hypothetical protein
MHPADMIYFWAKADPERLAIIKLDMAISYRGLAEATESASARIKTLGLKSGIPVAVSISDPAKLIAVTFALLRSGIPVAPVDQSLFRHLGASDINILISDRMGDCCWTEETSGSTIPVRREQPRFGLGLAAESRHRHRFDLLHLGTTGSPKKNVTPSFALMERVALLAVTGEGHGSRNLICPGSIRPSDHACRGADACWHDGVLRGQLRRPASLMARQRYDHRLAAAGAGTG